MASVFIIADASKDWPSSLLDGHVLPFLLASVAVVGGMAVAMAKAFMRHRERMAKIENGIDPDADIKPK